MSQPELLRVGGSLPEPGPTSRKSLVSKLAEVMAAVERVPKRGRNAFHGYDYATEADIADAIRKELAERGVMLIPEINSMTREAVGEKGSVLTTLNMTMTFIDGETGETLPKPWLGAGTDKEDKGLYKAMTGGEKYFLLKTFLIPTGDDPEREAPAAPAAAPAARKGRSFDAPRPTAQPAQPEPENPVGDDLVAQAEANAKAVTEERRALVLKASKLAGELGMSDDQKATVWATYCGEASPKTVDPAAVQDLVKFLQLRIEQKAS